ncbi:hypothetical protein D0Z07_3287 [Hyphodiscus hymeniophilus]|uniref:Elongator complex protein 6 n=1 Tax=Hyphodiscus hymeniophilus TaxID=353542 RepID=A0A9P6VMN2_9HELO|nr:hypothetical protein D0Z07_3287 [Hyphodiscus hymeniophilus]
MKAGLFFDINAKMTSRIPPLLEPYLALPPEASLILLTGVLGASTNWLVLRYLHSTLLRQDGLSEITHQSEDKVLLISFMRDFAFWKENGRRLGIDFDKLVTKKRFAFLDGLTGLFLKAPQKPSSTKGGGVVLSKSDLASVHEEIRQALESLKGREDAEDKVLLVVDQIDLLLAAGGDGITANRLIEMLMGLREHVYAIVVTLYADYPLLGSHQTPLETDHAALLLSLAHQADFTMSLRLLDSGTARDVSGVVRITVGDHAAEDVQGLHKRIEERELLYFVGGDGGVKVFERGQ